MTQLTPAALIEIGACSLEDPQPKFLLATIMSPSFTFFTKSLSMSSIQCVARIFYRNAINIGLPIIECPDAAKEIEAGDEVEVNFDKGVITDKTKGTSYQGQAFPPFMHKIIDCEGLVNSTPT